MGHFAVGQITVGTPINIQGLHFFLGLVYPSRNRLASTVYFAIVSSVFCMHQNPKKKIRCGQNYMKDEESAESKEKPNFSYFVPKCPQFSMNFHYNSKNKNRKFDFSSDSPDSASYMYI